MNYIILAAGVGKRLGLFTEDAPKCLIDLGGETVIERMVRLITEIDAKAIISIVIGFKHEKIREQLKEWCFIYNPFYRVTNSLASMWFADQFGLLEEATTIINGDIVLEKKLLEKIIKCKDAPFVLIDSSVKQNGDYNVQVMDDRVVMMSKDIKDYVGEYAGITKLDLKSALALRTSIRQFVDRESYNTWYESALVQMILDSDFYLNYLDIAGYKWTELDDANDIALARKIHNG